MILRAPAATHPCPCQTKHRPPVIYTHGHHVWPLYAGGPETSANVRHVCGSTHDWTHHILRVFARVGVQTRKQPRWPRYAYRLAVEGWEQMP